MEGEALRSDEASLARPMPSGVGVLLYCVHVLDPVLFSCSGVDGLTLQLTASSAPMGNSSSSHQGLTERTSSQSLPAQTVGVNVPPAPALPAGQVVQPGLGCQFQFLPVAIAPTPGNSLSELCPSRLSAFPSGSSILHLGEALPSFSGTGGSWGCVFGGLRDAAQEQWCEKPCSGGRWRSGWRYLTLWLCPVLHVGIWSSRGSDTCCVFAGSHMSRWLSQEVSASNQEPVTEGFPLVLVQLSSHRKRGCRSSLSLVYTLQPRCGCGAREQGDSFLPAPAQLGGFHLLSGGMRMESHRAQAPKTAWSLFCSPGLL